MSAEARRAAPWVLGAGLLAVSGASVLVRLAPEVPPEAAAFWRLALSAALMAAIAALRRESASGLWPHVLVVAAAGALLAAHFGLWFASLHRTSVAVSVVLVNTAPVQTALFDWWLTRRVPQRRAAIGIALGFVGASALAVLDARGRGPHGWTGDLLAIGGGTAIALYYLVARRLRAHAPLAPFTAAVYGAAALAAGAWVLAARVPLAVTTPHAAAVLVALAVVPQAIGHTSLNWALGTLPTASVAAIPLGEPLGAMLLAALVLGERPPVLALAVGAVALCGVALVVFDAAREGGSTS